MQQTHKLEELDAKVLKHKRAMRYHRRGLREAASERDRVIAQLEQLGIYVEQAQGDKTHGQDS